MASELLLDHSLVYADSNNVRVVLQKLANVVSVSTKKPYMAVQSIGFAAEEAIGLGEVTSVGYCCFVSLDATNYVELKTGTGGVIFAKLLPGEACGPIRLGSGAQAPYAIANTAAVSIWYCICST